MRPRDILLAVLITISAGFTIWSVVRGDAGGIVAGALLIVGMSVLAVGERKRKHQ